MTTPTKETFGSALRQAREAAGKTQDELATHLGYSTSYISDVERGYRAPWADPQVRKVAAFLGVDAAPLLAARSSTLGYVTLPLGGFPQADRLALLLAEKWAGLLPSMLDRIALAADLDIRGPEEKQRMMEAVRRMEEESAGRCHADSDGHCTWEGCPQRRDNEPKATGRSCPMPGAFPEDD